jgi:hypothetical protein
MSRELVISLSLVASICCTALAQKDLGGVDWEAKALATELHRLGDPDIDLILPDLYRAIARSPEELAESSGSKASFLRASQRSTMMDLLRDPKVRQELEMLDEQFQELEVKGREIQRSTNGRVLELLAEAKSGGLPAQKVRESIQAIRQEAEKEVERSILPFQFKRLKQIAYHVQMGRRGVADVLTKDPLASELQLTNEQKVKLRETAEAVEKELAEEITKLRAKAKTKLFAELNMDQQKRLSEILGDDFDGSSISVKTINKDIGKAKPNPKRDRS